MKKKYSYLYSLNEGFNLMLDVSNEKITKSILFILITNYSITNNIKDLLTKMDTIKASY